MDSKSPYSMERIADRISIQDVVYRWCRAVDRLDLEAVRPLFHPDAIDRHGAYEGGIDGLIAWLRDRHACISFSMHQVGNILIEFAGPDLALCESYLTHIQRYSPDAGSRLTSVTGGRAVSEGRAADLLGASRYIDRFERRDGVWRIAHRSVVAGWRSLQDVPDHPCGAHPNQDVQRRDLEDRVFCEQRALGIA